MGKKVKAQPLIPYRPDSPKLTQKLSSPNVIHGILHENNLHFSKSFGQNFLTDENTVERIADAADLGPEDTVIEVGPGIGTLTRKLAERAGKVYTVEIDKKLIPVLMNTLSDLENITLINEDILKLDFEDLLKDEKGPVKIAANLPYYITTPVIMGFLESDLDFERMSFLVQKEVAERLAAGPGSKAYGSLSIAAQYYADVDLAFTVPRTVFMPEPNVESAVITLTKKKETGLAQTVDKKLFLKLVKAAFLNRRKTLMNSLSQNTPYDKAFLLEALEEVGISPTVRAEKLSSDDFARLTQVIEKKQPAE